MESSARDTPARWMKVVLALAAVYNLSWGTFLLVAPETSLWWCGFSEPMRYPEIWQCLGMVIGVYGIGYGIASTDPYRHWAAIFVGFLGKIFGPIGMAGAILDGKLPLSAGRLCLPNDVAWWIPFGVILWKALQANRRERVSERVSSAE